MKIFSFLIKAIEKLCFALMLVMTFVTFAQAVNRYVFAGSFFWAEECAIWSMIWITMLGSTVALSRSKHTRIDFLINMFPAKVKKWIEVFDYVIIAAFLGYLGYASLPVVEKTGRLISPGLKLPRSIMFYAVLAGCVLMVVYALLLAFKKATGMAEEGGA